MAATAFQGDRTAAPARQARTMKLRPVRRDEAGKAAALLAEGFPRLSRETWETSIAKMFAHVETLGEASVGQFASVDGNDVGIWLVIPSIRTAYTAAPRKTANLASLYMRPGYEWMTALFMRRLMPDPAVDYVGLTAKLSMQQLGTRLGFVQRSRGAVVIPLVLAALRSSRGAKILSLADIRPDALPQHHHDLLERHARLGCLAVGIEVDGICHPLIMILSRRRGMLGARLVLARDRQLVRAALGVIARYLLKRGFLFLEFEGVSKAGFPEAFLWTRTPPVETTREPEGDAIDHTFTELVFVPSPGMKAGSGPG